MRISELEISGGIEFEGTNYRYWDFEVDDIVVKVAEFALQKALLPDYRNEIQEFYGRILGSSD